MNWILRNTMADTQNQTLLFTATVGGVEKSLAARFQYRRVIDKWTMTVMDGTTMEELISNVPLVSTLSEDTINDVLRQFEYLGIGSVVVQGTTTLLAKDDPYGSNLNGWRVLWGES